MSGVKRVASSTSLVHWQQNYAGRSLSWYVAPVAYWMTPITGADDLGRTQLAHRGQPGSEELYCGGTSTPTPPSWRWSSSELVTSGGFQEQGWCGRDVEPHITDGLPHYALTRSAGDRLRQHQPEGNCSSPVCRQWKPGVNWPSKTTPRLVTVGSRSTVAELSGSCEMVNLLT